MLVHVPVPERELGIAADVAALGFVLYAITGPRLAMERSHPELGPNVNRSTSSTSRPAPGPFAGDGPAFEGDPPPTVRETGVDLEGLDLLAREAGITPQAVGELYRDAGVDGAPLDYIAPGPTLDGNGDAPSS